jgi:hypothetical protein
MRQIMPPDPCRTYLERSLAILVELSTKLPAADPMLNERYLHHAFTHRLQADGDLLRLTTDEPPLLHPEWPTYKESTGLTGYGRYRKVEGRYIPDGIGGAGFLDFALGPYDRPALALEFHSGYGWAHEAMVFNLIKLLDGRNPFRAGVLYCVMLRKAALAAGQRLAALEQRMRDAFGEAQERLAAYAPLAPDRQLYGLITEIDASGQRRHWHLRSPSPRLARGMQDSREETRG